MTVDNLRELFVTELKDVYDAEHQITEALPKMADEATMPDLADAFREHLEQTKGQIRRLEQVFEAFGEKPERKTCEGLKGLVEEGEEMMEKKTAQATGDAALIASAQKVEHYEMATYGTLRTWAETLGEEKAAKLLQETLDEEAETDEKLTDLAVKAVNPSAVPA